MEALEQDLSVMKDRDEKHFNEELLVSNTVRSIIATLDGLDEFTQTKVRSASDLFQK